jgi:hypothetical protein
MKLVMLSGGVPMAEVVKIISEYVKNKKKLDKKSGK